MGITEQHGSNLQLAKGVVGSLDEQEGMSILTNPTLSPAQQAAAQIIQIAKQQYAQLARSGQMGFNLIWNNRQASPADVLAALGTNAEGIFALEELNQTTITSAATIGGATPPTLPSIPSGYSLSFNSDGSPNLVQLSSSSSGG